MYLPIVEKGANEGGRGLKGMFAKQHRGQIRRDQGYIIPG